MKKGIAQWISAALLLCLVGCGGRDAASVPGAPAASEPQPAPESTVEPAGAPEGEQASGPAETSAPEASLPETLPETGKTLIVYYSATGSTAAVAGYIADETGGDLFVLEPVQPYTSDDLNWRDENSRVVHEHDDPAARMVELAETTPAGWDSYDTVFVGYPIWWGIAAWPVDGFVAGNDFTGKTVIPFCTSSSSGLGESGSLLADAAGTGDWLEGMRFASSASEETVREWVRGLGL